MKFGCHFVATNGFNPQRPLILQAFLTSEIIPTRCRDLHLKQFCLEDIAPAILIVLITHIIIAVRWMLIKILSAVINHQVEYTVIVVVGLYVL